MGWGQAATLLHATRDQRPVLSSPSRSSSVEASPPEVVRRVDIEACRQHVLIAQRGDDTVQLTWVAGGAGGQWGAPGSPDCLRRRRGQPSHSPEESSLRQQSENPKRTAKCRGNMSWIPRLPGDKKGVRVDHSRVLQPRAGKGRESISLPCSVSTIRHQSTN